MRTSTSRFCVNIELTAVVWGVFQSPGLMINAVSSESMGRSLESVPPCPVNHRSQAVDYASTPVLRQAELGAEAYDVPTGQKECCLTDSWKGKAELGLRGSSDSQWPPGSQAYYNALLPVASGRHLWYALSPPAHTQLAFAGFNHATSSPYMPSKHVALSHFHEHLCSVHTSHTDPVPPIMFG